MPTIKINNREILPDGTVICSQEALVEILYSGKSLSSVFCSEQEDQQEWQIAKKICDTNENGPVYTDQPAYENINWYDYWLTPEEFKTIDLFDWCHLRCNTDQEHSRVDLELKELNLRQMFPIMKHLIYCVETWRANNIFWGVGRGSSVCSFVLYLIGINRINPLDYDLDIKEWLK